MKSVVPQIAVYEIRTIWRRGSFILDAIEYQSAFAISLQFEMPQVIKESWYIPSILHKTRWYSNTKQSAETELDHQSRH